MASAPLAAVLRHIHQLAGDRADEEWNDLRLLERFLERRDESAFRLLVERHGRMVLSVCRRVLQQPQDAEDAFQATFLVLAQRAGSIRKGAALASWLYGVAYRTALKARRQMSIRQRHEREACTMAQPRPDLDLALRELQAVLAEEVNRLPEKLRAPFVLCCLDGKSRSEAARQLGWKEGTVSGRLAEARMRLQQRLTRRGLTLAAVICAGAVGANVTAAVPAALARATIEAARGVVSAPVAALVEGVTRAMFLSKIKLVGVVVLAAGLLAAGVSSHSLRASINSTAEEKPVAPAARQAEKPADDKPAPKEDQVAVTGRVLDSEGKPVTGARVFLSRSVWGNAEKEGAPLAQGTGKSDGRFRLAMRRSDLVQGRSLVAVAAGYGLDWKSADKLGEGEVTFHLAKELPITGRILDLEGRPVPGVSVHVKEVAAAPEGDLDPVLKTIQRDGNRVFSHPLRAVHMAPESGVIPPVKTDEQGRFRITGVGAERVAVLRVEGPTIEHQSIYVLTRPDVSIRELVKNAPDRIGGLMPLPTIYGPSFDHVANASRPIVGVVRDRASGKPVPDVWINGSATHSWWENYVRAKTDREGRYRLIGLRKAPSYHLSVWGLQQNYLQVGKKVGDREGLESITQDFELVRGVRVRGRITDKTTGKPVPAALWYIPLADNKAFAMLPSKDSSLFGGLGHRTEKDGSYSLLALPGPGLIKVRAEIEGENPYTQAALEPADRSRASSTDPNEGLGITFIGVGGAIETLSGHNAYRIIDPAPEAESITCDMQFDRGQTRSGVVLDPDGKKPTGVRACGLTAMGSIKSLPDGSFKAIALNPGQPRLIAFAHKERKLVGHVSLSTDAKEPVTVRLQPGAVLTGRLLDEDGKPFAGITVSAGHRVNEARWLADDVFGKQPVTTDAAGRFRVEGIFPGLKFGLGLRKGNNFLVTDEKYQTMTLEAGTKDLGDITAKPFRPK